MFLELGVLVPENLKSTIPVPLRRGLFDEHYSEYQVQLNDIMKYDMLKNKHKNEPRMSAEWPGDKATEIIGT